MRCDYCNCPLTPANDGGHAPYGLPLYVCKSCYKFLKLEREKQKNEN